MSLGGWWQGLGACRLVTTSLKRHLPGLSPSWQDVERRPGANLVPSNWQDHFLCQTLTEPVSP